MASVSSVDVDDAEARGMLLGLAVLGADATVLADIEEPRRTMLGRAWKALEALDEVARDRTLAAWKKEAVDVDIAALARLHPSWIDEELAGERPELAAAIRAALAGGANADGCVRGLVRLALGRCVTLCEGPAGPLAEELCAMPLDDLLDAITRRGARAVGHSLASSPPALRVRAMAAVGEPWAQEIAAGARQALSSPARAAALALVECAGAREGRAPRERLLAIGLVALRDELAAEAAGSPSRVAGRLPAPLGRELLGRWSDDGRMTEGTTWGTS